MCGVIFLGKCSENCSLLNEIHVFFFFCEMEDLWVGAAGVLAYMQNEKCLRFDNLERISALSDVR